MSHGFTPDLARSAGLCVDRFPATPQEAAAVQDALSQAVAQLSLEDQEKALFDVHGIPRTIESSTATDSNVLESAVLQGSWPTDAFAQALQWGPTYVRSLYPRFLRAEGFQVTSAAEKMAQYFQIKRDLFGEGPILARDIRQSDLPDGDLEYLRGGFLQLSSVRDSSGRGVVFMRPMIDTVDAMNRMVFYWGTMSLHDQEIQENGIVCILMNYENLTAPMDYIQSIFQVEKSLPVRIFCWHYCFTDKRIAPFVKGIQLFAPPHDRFRFREHLGSLTDIEFSLQTYGIPTHVWPLQKDGSWDTTWFRQGLDAQRVKEETREPTPPKEPDNTSLSTADNNLDTAVIVPGRFDVLLGRGGPGREHTGNRRAVVLCEMVFTQYEKANKYQKTNLAEGVLSLIRESGGRFLKREEVGGRVQWVEADDLAARQKIAHVFRYMRSKVAVSPETETEAAS